MKRWMGLAAGLAAVVAAMPVAAAAEFPTKLITLILGFAPGGPSDVMARILTKKMEEILTDAGLTCTIKLGHPVNGLEYGG